MLTAISIIGSFVFGIGIGAAAVIKQVRSGRIEISGRVYFCKDTGPVVYGENESE